MRPARPSEAAPDASALVRGGGGAPPPLEKRQSMRTLIKNGTIVTAVDHYKGDIVVEDEKIALIGTTLEMVADKVIEASGKYVLPGGIDVHTHLDMPFGGTTSADDFETGTRAAAFGGTTSIVDFAIQYRGQTLHHAWDTWMKKAESKAVIDYGFHMIIK